MVQKKKECTCTEQAIAKYIGKISGPLLDRIDIQVEVNGIKYEKLESSNNIETSKTYKKSKLGTYNTKEKDIKTKYIF